MGTRSLTVFKEDGKEICVMYRQMDGYPTGHGQDLAEFLQDITMVNGISGDSPKTIANGIGCLTAQVIAYFKNESGIGGIYICPPKTRNCWEDYIYIVTGEVGENPVMECREVIGKRTKLLFKGTGKEYLTWVKGQEV